MEAEGRRQLLPVEVKWRSLHAAKMPCITLLLVLKRSRVPHFSRSLREVGILTWAFSFFNLLEVLEPTLFQHPCGNQFLLQMPLQDLNQEFPEVCALRLGPRHPGEAFHRSAKHLRGQSPRVAGNFGRP